MLSSRGPNPSQIPWSNSPRYHDSRSIGGPASRLAGSEISLRFSNDEACIRSSLSLALRKGRIQVVLLSGSPQATDSSRADRGTRNAWWVSFAEKALCMACLSCRNGERTEYLSWRTRNVGSSWWTSLSNYFCHTAHYQIRLLPEGPCSLPQSDCFSSSLSYVPGAFTNIANEAYGCRGTGRLRSLRRHFLIRETIAQ